MIQLFTMTPFFAHLSQVAFNARHAREGPRSKKGAKKEWPQHTMWGPLVISWFISPSNYSYKYHKP